MENQNSSALDQWKQIAAQFRKGKTRTNSQLMHRHAAVLGSLLASSDVVLGELVPDFNVLPAGVVGKALGNAHELMPRDRREAIWEWIGRQEQERQDVERTYAAPGVLRTSPMSAFRCLSEMRAMPTALTKEQRERLVAALADVQGPIIASLFSGPQALHQLRKVVRLLLTAAEEPRADNGARAAFLEGVLPTVVAHNMHTGSDNYWRQIQGLVERLGMRARAEVRDSLPDEVRRALGDLFVGQSASPTAPNQDSPDTQAQPLPVSTPRPVSVAQAELSLVAQQQSTPVVPAQPAPAAPEGIPDAPTTSAKRQPASPAGNAVDVKPDPLAWFDANIQMLAHARLFYVEAHQRHQDEKRRRIELEEQVASQARMKTELAVAKKQVQDLEARLEEAVHRAETWRADAESATKNAEAARQEKLEDETAARRDRENFEREREELSKRIDIHADKSVTNLRGALSNALSPLVTGVPEPGSPRANELGPNHLVIIHQILEALKEQGVVLRRSEGVTR